jgi:hypothetical protein
MVGATTYPEARIIAEATTYPEARNMAEATTYVVASAAKTISPVTHK